MDKKKLLLVDDNEIMRIFFKDVFWLHGLDDKIRLELADGVDTARKIMLDPKTCPDIIFLDLVMPFEKGGRKIISEEAGLELLKEIKADENLKKIRVFVFSSSDSKKTMEMVKKAGSEKFLVKQDHLPQDLVKVIEELCGEKSGNIC